MGDSHQDRLADWLSIVIPRTYNFDFDFDFGLVQSIVGSRQLKQGIQSLSAMDGVSESA
jgi:hypothetical protein